MAYKVTNNIVMENARLIFKTSQVKKASLTEKVTETSVLY